VCWLTGTTAVEYDGVVTARRPMSGSKEYSGGGSCAWMPASPTATERAASACRRAANSSRTLGPSGFVLMWYMVAGASPAPSGSSRVKRS